MSTDKACTIRTRKFITNGLLARRQFVRPHRIPNSRLLVAVRLSALRPGRLAACFRRAYIRLDELDMETCCRLSMCSTQDALRSPRYALVLVLVLAGLRSARAWHVQCALEVCVRSV